MSDEKKLKDSKDLFYIGLDIGTSSVGWAATNGDYELFKKNGKSTIGVRLFDEAQVAAERRVIRANKVRGARASRRITLLQELFAPFIAAVDPLFFSRLAASSYWKDDKARVKGMPEGYDFSGDLNSLFADDAFNDKDYFAQFPTIYHLRDYLCDASNWDRSTDVRLVYLALHHILKNRGHFIYEGQSFEMNNAGRSVFEAINDYLDAEYREGHVDNEGVSKDELLEHSELDQLPADKKLKIPSDFKIIDDIMRGRYTATLRTEELLCAFGICEKKPVENVQNGKKSYELVNLIAKEDRTRLEAILKVVCGRKFDIANILPEKYGKTEESELKSLEFNSKWDDETAPKLQGLLGEDFTFVERLKSAYDWGVLSKLLDGNTSISQAMLRKYENHGDQLKILKATVRVAIANGWLDKGKYDEIFRGLAHKENKIKEIESHYSNYGDEKNGTYASYIGSNLVHNQKYINVKDSKIITPKTNRENFYNYIKSVVLKMGGLSKWDELDRPLDSDYPRNNVDVQFTLKNGEIDSQNFVEILKDIKSNIDNNSYLLKLRNSDNGTIPYQLHQAELKAILQNAVMYGLIDADLDDDGLSVSDKVNSILTFRVPYYVGRLNPFYNSLEYKNSREAKGVFSKDRAHHVWIHRSDEYNKLRAEGKTPKILPWNYQKMIDLDKSGVAFIERMLAKCMYMHDETVVPKNSLIYSKFMVLNQLNTVKINDQKLPLDIKHRVFNELLLKHKKVKTRQLLEFLKTIGHLPDDFEAEKHLTGVSSMSAEEKKQLKAQFSGIDKVEGFTQGLSSWIQSKAVFDIDGTTNDFDNNRDLQDMVEQVLVWQAIHTDKKLVEKAIKKDYIHEITDYCREPKITLPMSEIIETDLNTHPELKVSHPKTIKVIQGLKGLNYKGFGNLCKEFLVGQWVECNNGLKTSILDLLWDGTDNPNRTDDDNWSPNLMQILGNPMDANNKVFAHLNQINYGDDISGWDQNDPRWYDIISNSYAAPSVKRSTWQSIKIINELISEIGKQPDKIFVEVTRSGSDMKGEQGKKSPRRTLLQDWYDTSKKYIDSYVFDELNEKDNNGNYKIDEKALRGEKLFLYFMQAGKCMYSGEPINLEELLRSGSTEYDVDHIIPQRLVKDDSIRNKVLVRRELNNAKSGDYPLNKIGKIWNNPKVQTLWKSLNNVRNKGQQKLLSDSKFARLSRTTEFSDSEVEGFVARQLVFAGQSTTVVAELLKQKYKNNLGEMDSRILAGSTLIDSGKDWSNSTEIVYSKAGNVSDFRKEYDFLKSREVNDFHHAHDAYLNIVVANTLQHWFGYFQNRHNNGEEPSSKWIFRYPVYRLGTKNSGNPECVWIPPQYEKETIRVHQSDGTFREVTRFAKHQKVYDYDTKDGMHKKGDLMFYTVKEDVLVDRDIIDEDGVLIAKRGDILYKKGDKRPVLSDTYKCKQYRGYLQDGKTPIYTGTLETVQKVLDYKFVLVTKMTREKRGQFYKQTLFSPGKHQRDMVGVDGADAGDTDSDIISDNISDDKNYNETVSDKASKTTKVKDKSDSGADEEDNNLIPRKGSSALLPSKSPLGNTSRYGGFKGKNAAYMCIVEYKYKDVYAKDKVDKKTGEILIKGELKSNGETVRRWLPIYIMDKPAWEKWDNAQRVDYIEKLLLDDRDAKGNLSQEAKKIQPGTISIIVEKIDINTKIKIGNVEAFAVGYNTASGIISCQNAKQWHIDYEWLKYIRIITKYLTQIKDKQTKVDDWKDKNEILVSGKVGGNLEIFKLTRMQNMELFDYIVTALDRTYGSDYTDRLSGNDYTLTNKSTGFYDIGKTLTQNRAKFQNLDITQQINVLQGMIDGLGVNAKTFSGIKDLAVNTAAIKPNVKISYPLTIVTQSITGLRQKETVIYPFMVDGEWCDSKK